MIVSDNNFTAIATIAVNGFEKAKN